MSAQSAQQPSTELALPEPKAPTLQQRVVAAMGERDETALRKLADGTKDITVITNPAGYQQVHAARMVLKNERIAIEKDCKKAREDALAFGKAVIVEEKRLIGIISPEEDRLEKLQKTWDDAREAERLAKVAAEKARVDLIRGRIEDDIRAVPLACIGRSAHDIVIFIKDIEAMAIDHTFAEFQKEAEGAKATTLIRLRAALANAQAMEAEQARLAAEREENERMRLANEAAAKAERERIAEEERIAKEARDREAAEHRARLAEQERAARETREAEAAQQAAENERIRVENERVAAAERQRIADESAALQARRDAQAAEELRLAQEREAREIEQAAEARRIETAREQLLHDQEALKVEREKPAPVYGDTGGTFADTAGSFQPVDESAAESGLVAQTLEEAADPLLTTIRLTEFLPMQSVCKAAKEWANFQRPDSKTDQKGDRKLKARARDAEAALLIAVEMLPTGAAA